MGKEKNNNFFLKNTKLSGYKSVIDIDINFKEGLNIIIGKNAAGKTNFLTLLSNVLEYSFDDLLNFSSSLSFKNGKEILVESASEIEKEDLISSNIFTATKVKSIVKIDGVLIEDTKDNKGELDAKIKESGLLYSSTFVRHGIPENFYLVDSPFSFKVDKKGFPSDFFKQIGEQETPYFVKSLLAGFLFSSLITNEGESLNEEVIKERLLTAFNRINKIKDSVVKYSPIEDIRYNKNFNIFLDEDREKYSINNIFIEFKVDGNWHPFSNLSDGTKRLFYIIAEVAYSDGFHYSKSSFGFHTKDINRIILLEEPELGVHPHQLKKLMDFLNDESKRKQIIITTHSPQILDVLNPEELDRIILAYSTSVTEGTKLRHLEDSEISKALKYLEEDFLSDYWKYSDLEK